MIRQTIILMDSDVAITAIITSHTGTRKHGKGTPGVLQTSYAVSPCGSTYGSYFDSLATLMIDTFFVAIAVKRIQ